jgi:hypothetical protein
LAIKTVEGEHFVRLLGPDGSFVDLGENPDALFSVITSKFVACDGGDGFNFTVDNCLQKIIVDFSNRDSDGKPQPLYLNELLSHSLSAMGDGEAIAPVVDGRLCQSEQACQYDRL